MMFKLKGICENPPLIKEESSSWLLKGIYSSISVFTSLGNRFYLIYGRPHNCCYLY